jgi:hypothetical protein
MGTFGFAASASTNTGEAFFSILKRGITGAYNQVSDARLRRYLANFDFSHNARSAFGVEDSHWSLEP